MSHKRSSEGEKKTDRDETGMKTWAGWCHKIIQKRELLESAEVTLVRQVIWLRNIIEEQRSESVSLEN